MRTKFYLIALMAVVIGFGACGGSEDEKSSINTIKSFKTGTDDWSVNNNSNTITVSITKTTNSKELTPTIELNDSKATITPGSGVKQDFSSTVDYTVKAENGDERVYKATVTWQ